MENNITSVQAIPIETISIGIIVIGIIVIGVYKYKTNKKSSETSSKPNQNDLEDKIKTKLERLKEEFKQEAINYYLPTLLLDSNLSEEKREELLDEPFHTEVLSLERIKWDKYFSITGDEGNILDELLEEEVKYFSKKDDYLLSDAFKFMLIEEAKKEAKKIIKSKEENV